MCTAGTSFTDHGGPGKHSGNLSNAAMHNFYSAVAAFWGRRALRAPLCARVVPRQQTLGRESDPLFRLPTAPSNPSEEGGDRTLAL